MKCPSKLYLAAIVVFSLAALSTDAASATTLEVGGVAQNKSVAIEVTLASGSSSILKDTNNLTVDTCSNSAIKGATESPFTDIEQKGVINIAFQTNCSHKTTVIKPGKLSVAWTSGTNGRVSSSEAEVTVESTVFGISCTAKTGAGTTIGTLTGVNSGKATMDVNGVIPMGLCGDANWTGTYTVTSPEGLGVVS